MLKLWHRKMTTVVDGSVYSKEINDFHCIKVFWTNHDLSNRAEQIVDSVRKRCRDNSYNREEQKFLLRQPVFRRFLLRRF